MLTRSHFFAVFESQFMIASHDELHLMRQFSHFSVKFDHLANVPVIGKIAGVDKYVTVRNHMSNLIHLLVRIRNAHKTDFVRMYGSV